ncbi:hypothetical protein NMG60_11013374 [Bertholletia excelsa]
MAKPFFFLTVSLLLLYSLSSSASGEASTSPPLNAHTELRKYGFPVGLLPTNVREYTLNATSGHFAVHLGDTCRLTLPPDNYIATYSKRITGKIVAGKIADLDGIRVRAFFRWWSITGIKSNGDELVFEVGMVTAKYASKNFDESPECDGKSSAS